MIYNINKINRLQIEIPHLLKGGGFFICAILYDFRKT